MWRYAHEVRRMARTNHFNGRTPDTAGHKPTSPMAARQHRHEAGADKWGKCSTGQLHGVLVLAGKASTAERSNKGQWLRMKALYRGPPKHNKAIPLVERLAALMRQSKNAIALGAPEHASPDIGALAIGSNTHTTPDLRRR